jgi:ornithine cyclodeaminase/alanine dehydrogenase
MVLILSRQDVESLLTMGETLDIMEEGFRQLSIGNVIMPQRPVVQVEKQQGIFLIMPAYVSGEMNIFSNKIVTVYPNNPERYRLPTILASITLYDVKTGELLSIMDGSFITAMRTGAASGVATKHLARKDSETVGILGTGIQARTQIEAMCETLNIERVKAYGLDRDQMQHFCQDMGEKLSINMKLCNNSEEVVRGSDVVILATSSKTPVLDGNWLDEGTHINAIGSHTPTTRELDDTSVQRSKIIVDLKEAALLEAGDLLIPISKGLLPQNPVYAELGELVTGRKRGRINDQEITLFKSVGLAVQDAAAAFKVYSLAREAGLGKNVPI